MSKTRTTVCEEGGNCTLNQPPSLKNKKGFSVAEATIALLIGSIILGMSAPMITSQIKRNNFSDVQSNILNRRIENLQREISALRQTIENMETGVPEVDNLNDIFQMDSLNDVINIEPIHNNDKEAIREQAESLKYWDQEGDFLD